ncbi:MAG: hypothetical protein OES41_03270, partial [Rhodospirillales bacterium]|nr:hypothetical protein [Rhodospirillales bacterium]
DVTGVSSVTGSNHFGCGVGLRNPQTQTFPSILRRIAAGAAVFGVTLAASLFLAAGPGMAGAGEDDFHKVLRAHKIVSLQQLLAHVHRDFHARILKVNLAQVKHRGQLRWVYEAKIMTPEGNVLELEYDAKSLELLELEGEHGRQGHDHDDG